jgi:hypothetical protein
MIDLNHQPSAFETAGKIARGLWVTLFALLLTFIVGGIIWAFAGTTYTVVIFALAIGLFVVLPLSAARRQRR